MPVQFLERKHLIHFDKRLADVFFLQLQNKTMTFKRKNDMKSKHYTRKGVFIECKTKKKQIGSEAARKIEARASVTQLGQ